MVRRLQWIICLLALSLDFSAHAGEHGKLCEWFGWGCPEGGQSAVLLDLGRQSTNTGFLFFSGDTAVMERTLEFTFSNRSIRYQDKLTFQVVSNGLPDGSSVTLDGRNCLSPASLTITAKQPRQEMTIRWVVPPTGEDVDLSGTIKVTPVGFERAGLMSLDGSSRSIELLRIHGEVDDDWHWAKRLTFWFWTLVFVTLGSIKFFFAPVFFHPRLKVNKAVVECFPAEGPFAQGMGSAIESKKWKGKREVWIVGSRRKKREKLSWWRDFLYGRTLVEVRDYIGDAEFRVRRGARSRRGGMRLEVMRWENGKKFPFSIFSTNEPELNRVDFVGENQSRLIQFDIE